MALVLVFPLRAELIFRNQPWCLVQIIFHLFHFQTIPDDRHALCSRRIDVDCDRNPEEFVQPTHWKSLFNIVQLFASMISWCGLGL